MRYREAGRCGLKISEIGLGCEGFVGRDAAFVKEVFDAAEAAGVNCFDLYSPDPELRSYIGAAMRGRRDKFMIQAHLCTFWENGQYRATRDPDETRSSFEELLSRLETDHADIGMIHYVDTPELWREIAEGPLMRFALEQKRAGRIRAVGMSSHNPAAALAAAESGLADVIMFSVNPCYDLLPGTDDCEALWAGESYEGPLLNMDPERERFYERCQELGIAITIMKAFGGGDLLTEDSPAGAALTVNQCLHYALTRPAVVSVMAGARGMEEFRACLAYEEAAPEERDFASALASFPKMSWKGHCMYCGHCAPCPVGIEVASVTKFLNLARAQRELPETVREHYRALTRRAGDCISCGACESRCPFGVAVRENMREAKKIFGE